jgi:hypothetical protein
MTNRQMKLPGPDHPISIADNPARVRSGSLNRMRPTSGAWLRLYLKGGGGSRARAAHALHRIDELFAVKRITVINIDRA